MSKKRKYIKIEDSAHSWTRVSIAEAKRLGVINNISESSYMRGRYIFLEEDCDAPLFFEAKKRKKEKYIIDNKFVMGTNIRNYERFALGA